MFFPDTIHVCPLHVLTGLQMVPELTVWNGMQMVHVDLFHVEWYYLQKVVLYCSVELASFKLVCMYIL